MSTRLRQAVIDTSVLIDPERVAEHADQLAVSILTIAELQYGITADDDLIWSSNDGVAACRTR